jgi:hypothetical protein
MAAAAAIHCGTATRSSPRVCVSIHVAAGEASDHAVRCCSGMTLRFASFPLAAVSCLSPGYVRRRACNQLAIGFQSTMLCPATPQSLVASSGAFFSCAGSPIGSYRCSGLHGGSVCSFCPDARDMFVWTRHRFSQSRRGENPTNCFNHNSIVDIHCRASEQHVYQSSPRVRASSGVWVLGASLVMVDCTIPWRPRCYPTLQSTIKKS